MSSLIPANCDRTCRVYDRWCARFVRTQRDPKRDACACALDYHDGDDGDNGDDDG